MNINAYKINDWTIENDQRLFEGLKWVSEITDELHKMHWNSISKYIFGGKVTGPMCKKRFNKIWKPKIKFSDLKKAGEIKVSGNEIERFVEIKKVWTKKEHESLLRHIHNLFTWEEIAEQLGVDAKEAKKTFDEVWSPQISIQEIEGKKGKYTVHRNWDLSLVPKSLDSLKRKNPDSEVSQQPAKKTCLEERTADLAKEVNDGEKEYKDDEIIFLQPDPNKPSSPCELFLSDSDTEANSGPVEDNFDDLCDFDLNESDDSYQADPSEILMELNPGRNLPRRTSSLRPAATDSKKAPIEPWTTSEEEKLLEFIRRNKDSSIGWRQIWFSMEYKRTPQAYRSHYEGYLEDLIDKISNVAWKNSRNIEITINRSLGKIGHKPLEGNEYKVSIKREGLAMVDWTAEDDRLLLKAYRDEENIKNFELPGRVKWRHSYYECNNRLKFWRREINMPAFKRTQGKEIFVKIGPEGKNYLESPKLSK